MRYAHAKSILALASAGFLLVAGGHVASPPCVRRRIRREPAGPLKGKVSKLELVNPHAWIHIEGAK